MQLSLLAGFILFFLVKDKIFILFLFMVKYTQHKIGKSPRVINLFLNVVFLSQNYICIVLQGLRKKQPSLSSFLLSKKSSLLILLADSLCIYFQFWITCLYWCFSAFGIPYDFPVSRRWGFTFLPPPTFITCMPLPFSYFLTLPV